MRKWIGFFFTLCCTVAFADTTNNENLLNVSKQIQILQRKMTLDQQQQDNLQQQLKLTETHIGQLSNQVDELNQIISREQHKLTQLKTTHHVTSKKLSAQNTVLADEIRAAFALGKINSTKIMLNQTNPNTTHRYLHYFHCLTQARIRIIQKISRLLAEQHSTIRSTQEYQHHLKELLVEKQKQQLQQKQTQQQRQALLDQLHHTTQNQQQQLNTLLANQKALHDIIMNLPTQPQTNLTTLSFDQNQKKLHWPTKGKIVAHFGSVLDVGNQRLPGVIINAQQGNPVRAIFAGKVIFANWLRGFGLLIIIDHGNNYLSLYGRNHTLNVKVGDLINTGDIIATIGNSGGFDKSSLYFEIREHGIPVNPHIWCV